MAAQQISADGSESDQCRGEQQQGIAVHAEDVKLFFQSAADIKTHRQSVQLGAVTHHHRRTMLQCLEEEDDVGAIVGGGRYRVGAAYGEGKEQAAIRPANFKEVAFVRDDGVIAQLFGQGQCAVLIPILGKKLDQPLLASQQMRLLALKESEAQGTEGEDSEDQQSSRSD